MKDKFLKLWPILLPIVCLLAGILSFILFFCVDKFYGHYDIIAIGAILIAISILSFVLDIISRKKKK